MRRPPLTFTSSRSPGRPCRSPRSRTAASPRAPRSTPSVTNGERCARRAPSTRTERGRSARARRWERRRAPRRRRSRPPRGTCGETTGPVEEQLEWVKPRRHQPRSKEGCGEREHRDERQTTERLARQLRRPLAHDDEAGLKTADDRQHCQRRVESLPSRRALEERQRVQDEVAQRVDHAPSQRQRGVFERNDRLGRSGFTLRTLARGAAGQTQKRSTPCAGCWARLRVKPATPCVGCRLAALHSSTCRCHGFCSIGLKVSFAVSTSSTSGPTAP